ncbi:WYL domain-containing protein [Tissierella sp.]|uniref:WYL domain-containing protein n=1 Tax=Tissierella sp. TaxID=41274 RepID=UPI0028A71E71|nr:WYL domain-containing protein [Tissierella sp.]
MKVFIRLFLFSNDDVDKDFVPRRDGEIYRVIPYSLNWANEKYYLVGYYERYDKIVSFRVDKMGEARISDEDAIGIEKYKDFDIVEYENKI